MEAVWNEKVVEQKRKQEDKNTSNISLRDVLLSPSSVKVPITSKVQLTNNVQRLLAAAKFNRLLGSIRIFLLLIARPVITSIIWRVWKKIKKKIVTPTSSSSNLSLSYYILLTIICIPSLTRRIKRKLMSLFQQESIIRGGVYHGGPKTPSCNGATICQLEKKVKNYWMNPYMNGDWSTIFPTAIDLLVQYIRQLTGSSDDTSNINTIRRHIVNRQNEIVAVDWTLPVAPPDCSKKIKLIVFLAGVGGDSSAFYIRQCTDRMVQHGWITCTINPRGLQNSPNVQHVSNSFSPYNMDDLEDVLEWMEMKMKVNLTANYSIVLCGFSLGAISLGKYITSHTLHPSIKGHVLISGAFHMKFAEWWRYKYFFQPLIVPELCIEFLSRYGNELELILSQSNMNALGTAISYEEMVRHLLLPIVFLQNERKNVDGIKSYTDFQNSAASSNDERRNIQQPTLMMCSLDDPLHCPDMIGVDLTQPIPKNLCYMITEEGGHVSFPTHFNGSSTLLKDTVMEWSEFCLHNHEL